MFCNSTLCTAGLISTIKDYAVFLQMLLNGGHYNDYQILSRRTVEIMTMNRIGKLSLGNNKFGLGFEITTNEGMEKLGQTEGPFAWGDFFSSIFFLTESYMISLKHLFIKH